MKSQQNTTQKQYKCGDVREDGYIFVQYKTSGHETWLSQKSYHRRKVHDTLAGARRRSYKNNLPFDLDIDYLLSIYPVDNKCPVFGIELSWGDQQGRENSPSLDKIHPSLGYIKGNVVWVSMYANRLKSDHSLNTLRTLLAFYENLERKKE